MRILMFAALPQEYGSFLRRSGNWRLLTRRPFRQFSSFVSGKELFLIETGMGEESMEKAMKWASAWRRPDLVVSMGFAGSLCPDLRIGDVLLGNDFVRLIPLGCPGADGRFILNVPTDIVEFLKGFGVATGRIVTVTEPQDKARMADRFRDLPSAMDMETHVAARFACAARVPFLCLRSISDGVEDEIDYDLGAIMDCRGKVRVGKVVSAVLLRPGLIKSFAVSWRRALRAADELGKALCGFLSFPTASLLSLAALCRIEHRDGEGEERCSRRGCTEISVGP